VLMPAPRWAYNLGVPAVRWRGVRPADHYRLSTPGRSRRGAIKADDAGRIRGRAGPAWRAFAIAFGLTPSAEQRLGIAVPELAGDGDPFVG